MVLTAANLFYYLEERGLASADTVVRGEFRVIDLSRRNLVFRMSDGSGAGGVLIKQLQTWQRVNVALFEAEAHWYWLARYNPAFAPLSPFLCRCLGYDSQNQILMLEIPAGCENFDGHFRRIRGFSPETARLLGETLAAFHWALPASALHELRNDFARRIPSVFFRRESNESEFHTSEGALEVFRIVKENPAFIEACPRLRNAWQRETPINGDMKFAHCILNGPGMYFVDWENGDIGDPCWDTGAIFQEFLRAWILSIPGGPGDTLEERSAKAAVPMPEIQPAVRAFWESYVKRAGFDDEIAAAKLRKSVDYAGAWLLQAAFQHVQDVPRITSRAVSMVQLGLNILEEPERATRDLLGL